MYSALIRHRKPLLLTLWGLVVAGFLRAEPLFDSIFDPLLSICGVWGCGPPLSSLIVWHGFVALVAVPAAVWLPLQFPSVGRWGRLVLVAAFLMALLYVGINTTLWWQGASAYARSFVWQRMLFSLVAYTDAPVVPLLSAAVIFWFLGRRATRVQSCGPEPVVDSLPVEAV